MPKGNGCQNGEWMISKSKTRIIGLEEQKCDKKEEIK
jgi:hypothetical protein